MESMAFHGRWHYGTSQKLSSETNRSWVKSHPGAVTLSQNHTHGTL